MRKDVHSILRLKLYIIFKSYTYIHIYFICTIPFQYCTHTNTHTYRKKSGKIYTKMVKTHYQLSGRIQSEFQFPHLTFLNIQVLGVNSYDFIMDKGTQQNLNKKIVTLLYQQQIQPFQCQHHKLLTYEGDWGKNQKGVLFLKRTEMDQTSGFCVTFEKLFLPKRAFICFWAN